MIVFESVTKVYEPDVVALNNVTFHIDERASRYSRPAASRTVQSVPLTRNIPGSESRKKSAIGAVPCQAR